jgi:hypothetical protein
MDILILRSLRSGNQKRDATVRDVFGPHGAAQPLVG